MDKKITVFLAFTVTCLLGMLGCVNKSGKTASQGMDASVVRSATITEAALDYKKAALVNVELGLGYLAQGQVARAKSKLTHAIKLAPNLSETHSAMAYFLEMVGERKDAEREYKKSVNLSVNKGAVYNNYGAFLCRGGRFKEADHAFQEALQDKEYSRTAEVYENAGLCALKWREQQKAKEYLLTAIRRDPTRSMALLELTDLDIQQSKFNEARDFLNRYRAVAEPSARSLWLGIQVAKALNDSNGIASQVLLLKNLFEDSPEYQLYLKSEH
jgi:type IV pilus assembly protein PilF